MARTYSGTPVLSKIKIGNSTYWLKDADARAILDGIDASIYTSLTLGFGQVDGVDADKLVKAGDIKAYVDRIAELGFDVVKLASLPTADEDAYEAYHNKIVLIEDPDAASGSCIEYIIMRSGTEGDYDYDWEKIGSTKADLSDYVSNVGYVDNTHTLTQTKGGVASDVHVFGDFADADKGEVNLSNYVTGVTAEVDTLSSIDSISVYDNTTGTLPSKAADTFNQGTLPTFTYGAFDAGELPSKEADTFDEGALPSFTEGAFNPGTLPTFTYGAYVAPTLTTDTKALYKQGMKAEVGTGDDAETLIISNVEKEADIKVVNTFTPGSKTPDTFDPGTLPSKAADTFDAGELPSFEEGEFDAGELPSKAADTFNPGTLPTFTEGQFNAGAFPGVKTQPITFTKTTATVDVTLTKGGNEEVSPK